jgi:GNAT superfamily N-acetyltransferase
MARLLDQLGYPQDPETFPAVLQAALKDPGLNILLAELGDRCLALLCFRTFLSIRLAGYQISIEELVVAPEARGKRLGSRLVDQVKDRARQCGAVLLEVHTRTSRESFKRQFYIKKGFERAESCVLRWRPNGRSSDESDRSQRNEEPSSPCHA